MAFILNVTYTMKPGLRAEFLREVSEHGIQKAVLAEEGCLQYQYFEAVDEPDKLLLVEKWTLAGASSVISNRRFWMRRVKSSRQR